MTDNDRSKRSDGANDEALEHELEDLGLLMDRKSESEKERPDPSFVRDLRCRLVDEPYPKPSSVDGDTRQT